MRNMTNLIKTKYLTSTLGNIDTLINDFINSDAVETVEEIKFSSSGTSVRALVIYK